MADTRWWSGSDAACSGVGPSEMMALDPMAGGGTIPIEAAGLAAGAAIRRPMDLPLGHLTAFEDLPIQTPDLFPGMGRAFARFKGWRAACFVANPRFVDTFGHAPVMTKPASNADLRGAFLVYGF